MNNIKALREGLAFEEQQIQRRKKALDELEPRLEGFKHDLNVSFCCNFIDFDYLGREKTIDLIQHFHAGKWDKELTSSDSGKINYVNKNLLTNAKLRIYGAEPPPSCKIVEESYEIPAQPARIGTRRKIVCSKGVDPLAP